MSHRQDYMTQDTGIPDHRCTRCHMGLVQTSRVRMALPLSSQGRRSPSCRCHLRPETCSKCHSIHHNCQRGSNGDSQCRTLGHTPRPTIHFDTQVQNRSGIYRQCRTPSCPHSVGRCFHIQDHNSPRTIQVGNRQCSGHRCRKRCWTGNAWSANRTVGRTIGPTSHPDS